MYHNYYIKSLPSSVAVVCESHFSVFEQQPIVPKSQSEGSPIVIQVRVCESLDCEFPTQQINCCTSIKLI